MSLHPNEVLLAPVVSEKSYGLIDRPQVHVQGAPGRAQDAGPPGRRGALRRQGRSVQHLKVQPKPKRRGLSRGTRPGWKKAIVQLREGETIEIFEGAQV